MGLPVQSNKNRASVTYFEVFSVSERDLLVQPSRKRALPSIFLNGNFPSSPTGKGPLLYASLKCERDLPQPNRKRAPVT